MKYSFSCEHIIVYIRNDVAICVALCAGLYARNARPYGLVGIYTTPTCMVVPLLHVQVGCHPHRPNRGTGVYSGRVCEVDLRQILV